MCCAVLRLDTQSYLTLCDPVVCSLPCSSVPGILQARTLEWVAISFTKAWKWKVKVKSFSCIRLLVTPWTTAYQAPPSMGFSRQEYWSGLPFPSPDSAYMHFIQKLEFLLCIFFFNWKWTLSFSTSLTKTFLPVFFLWFHTSWINST